MLQDDDQAQLVSVTPPLDAAAVQALTALAGAGPGPRRIWAGQPGPRSPWLPCRGGCCLVLESHHPLEAEEWLRFLVREVVAPRAAASVARARAAGLSADVAHRLRGDVVLDDGVTLWVLQATGRRVRVVAVPDDVAPPRVSRSRAEVVELHTTER